MSIHYAHSQDWSGTLLRGSLNDAEEAPDAGASDPAFQSYEQNLLDWIEAADDDTRPYVAAVKFNELPDIAVLSLSSDGRDALINVLNDATDNPYAVTALERLKRAMLEQSEFQPPGDPDLDRKLFANLAGQTGDARATVAAEFMNGLEDHQAMFLLRDTQLRTLKLLQGAPVITPAIRWAREKLHNTIDHGEVYEAERQSFRANLTERLARDPQVQQGLQRWHRMDNSARRDLLQHVADTQNDMAGNPRVPVVLEHIEPRDTPDGMRVLKGRYKHDGPITINTGVTAFWEKPEAVIGTTVHENTHHDQHVLGQAYASGEIERDDPRYVAAAIFDDGLNHGYVSSKTDLGHYQNQLVERLARATQGAVQKRLQGLGLSFDHQDDAELIKFMKAQGIDLTPGKEAEPTSGRVPGPKGP